MDQSIQLNNSNNDSITQYIVFSMNYERNNNNFREKKDKFFNIQQKSSHQFQTDSPHNHGSTRRFPIAAAKFILRLTTAAQLQQILQDSLGQYQQIIILDLSNSRINQLPEQMGNLLPSLQIVNLPNNLLTDLPQSIHNLRLLQINLNNNLFRTLHISNAWNHSLEQLDVGKNHIRNLPDQLWLCKKLSSLDIRSNDFDFISFSILNLKPTLNTLGLDWVKYSLHMYRKYRQDIINDRMLSLFWSTVESISNQKVINMNCDEFLQIFDEQCLHIAEEEEIEQNQQLNREIGNAQTNQIERLGTNENVDQKLNQFQFQNQKVMHMTVINEDLGVLRTLIQKNYALTQTVDDNNHSPLSLAIQEEKYHCAKILLNSQVDVNIGGGPLGSCINLAVNKGQYFLLRDLLTMNGDLNRTDKQGNGPIHYLMNLFRKNNNEAIKMSYLLIQYGANVNSQNLNGLTPLQIAVKKSIFQAVKFAQQYNQDHQSKIFDFKVKSSPDYNNCNIIIQINLQVIHLAAKSEATKIIVLLLKIIPKAMFDSNAIGQRPYDVVQKNYTLSKIIQASERVYLNNLFLNQPQNTSAKQKIRKDAFRNLSKPSLYRCVQPLLNSKSSISIMDSGDDDGQSKHLQGVSVMQINSPKMKRSSMAYRTINNENQIQKFTENRVPIEYESRKPIKCSFTQCNNLLSIENFNRTSVFKSHLCGAVVSRHADNLLQLIKQVIGAADMALHEFEILKCLTVLCQWRDLNNNYDRINFVLGGFKGEWVDEVKKLEEMINRLEAILNNQSVELMSVESQEMLIRSQMMEVQNTKDFHIVSQYEFYQHF